MRLVDEIRQSVKRALKEDIPGRDITTDLVPLGAVTCRGVIICKNKGKLCGINVAKETFLQAGGPGVVFRALKKDGDILRRGDRVAVLNGKAAAVLAAERVALNFLAFLSGIASLTQEFVSRTKGTPVKIRDTRKTLPAFRALSKYAVKTGGGYNHRSSLSESILIKDNHFKAAGTKAILAVLACSNSLKVEIEVETLKEFEEVIKYKPAVVLLDNFSLKDIKRAVTRRNAEYPAVKLEASGGITLDNLRGISRSGVDFIAVGAITHSAPAIDFSLEIEPA